jgi:hypothetical protein
MLNNIFMISLSMSAVILLLLIISPILNKISLNGGRENE